MALEITLRPPAWGQDDPVAPETPPTPTQPAAAPTTSDWGANDPVADAAPPQKPKPATTAAPSTLDNIADTALFLGQHAARAASELPGLPADVADLAGEISPGISSPVPAVNALALAGRAVRSLVGPDRMMPLGSQNIRAALHDVTGGALTPREPRNDFERYGGAIADFAGASAVPAAGMVGKVRNPIAFLAGEAAAATGGGIGEEAARDIAPDSPWAPAIGALAGSLTPTGLTSGVRGFIRGGATGAKRVEDSLADFAKIGAKPTLAQATSGGYWPGQYLARLLEFSPGGVLPSFQRWKSQLDAAAKRVADVITRQTGGLGTSEQAAGDALQAGAKRFADKVSRTAGGLEARLERAVPGQTLVAPAHTLSTLRQMTAIGTGSEVGAATVSTTLRDALRRFNADTTGNGGVPFEALKAFRTNLGAKTQSGQSLIGDVSAGQAKQLYAALTRDMEDAAAANGAADLVKLRNQYYASRKGQIEDIFDARISSANTVEQAYRNFKNADLTQQRAIMRQLTPTQRRQVAGQFLHDLGLPPPGQATGDTAKFSYDAFDTAFEKLNRKGSLDPIFSMSGTEDMRTAIQDLSRVAERFKGAEKFMRNPSQSAIVGYQIGAGGGIGYQALGDPVGALFTAGLFYGLPYALLKGGNSAPFLRFLARTGRQTPETLPGHIARMAAFVQQNPQYAPAFQKMLDTAWAKPEEAGTPKPVTAVASPVPAKSLAPAATTAAAPSKKALKVGQTVTGVTDGKPVSWKYLGGDPKEQASWQRATP